MITGRLPTITGRIPIVPVIWGINELPILDVKLQNFYEILTKCRQKEVKNGVRNAVSTIFY